VKKQSLKLFRKLHKWPGIVIAFLSVLFALSGIVLNHRPLFSSLDINRQLLPPGYQYENWNLAAVRGNLICANGDELIYGNIGIWRRNGNDFVNFNQGFPPGIDQRKIASLVQTSDQQLWAATQFGLYQRKLTSANWTKVNLPNSDERLTDLTLKGDSLIILSRSYLFKSGNGREFELMQLTEPDGYVKETTLFKTFWQLHSGELFGLSGKLFVDLLGAVIILLCITGLLHFFFPKIAKRRKAQQKDNTWLTASRRINLRWHNWVGYVFIAFLLIDTLAGIFLRPPLLLAIATSKVKVIPGTNLDTPNPWDDKLRRISWDESLKSYLLSTSDGFFMLSENLKQSPRPMPIQPPVSVMGCNVLTPVAPSRYLVGSFSGLFVWDLKMEQVVDAFSGKTPIQSSGRPISDNMITGYIETANGEHFIFDYNNKGMQNFENNNTWEMPSIILNNSPLSLWNTALEVHTGRIFEHLIGPFYILYVPLSGLCLMMVLISGFLIWWKAF